MGVNSHQISTVWCLTRKGTKNSEDQIDDEKMGDQLTKWVVINVVEMGDRMDDEICKRIDEMGDQIDENR